MDSEDLINNIEKDDVDGLTELGRRLREGPDADLPRAVECLKKASDMGGIKASSALGYMYMSGDGVERDEKTAEFYMLRAAEEDPVSMSNLGVLYMMTRPEESFKWFEKAAATGHVCAMKNLAASYDEGRGVEPDKAKAIEWYTRAMDSGDIDAMCIMASKIRNGDGVPEDKKRAAELYRAAADQGDMAAQYDLAFMLDTGEGVETDHEGAEKYFKMSAEQGDTDACLCYGGILFERGDYKTAEDFFLSAAMKGDVKAQYNLGLIYYGDYLGGSDFAKAAEWFGYSAEQGFVYAHSMLGTMALDAGKVDSAEEHFRFAAKEGEPTSQYNLGALGLSGQVKMDFQEAVEWLSKSAQQGYEPAFEVLMRLNSQGSQ